MAPRNIKNDNVLTVTNEPHQRQQRSFIGKSLPNQGYAAISYLPTSQFPVNVVS